MNFDLKLGKAASVLFLALAMAGCGGGGSTTETMPPEPPPPDPAIAERAAIATAIGAAQTAVGMVDDDSDDATVSAADTAIAGAKAAIAAATNVPEPERNANSGTVATLESNLNAAKMSRTTAMNEAAKAKEMEMMATAMKLHMGISASGGTGDDARTAAYNGDDIAVTIGSATAVDLSEDEDAMVAAHKGWEGMMFTAEPDGDAGTYEAVVYSNVGEPTEGAKFNDTANGGYALDATTGETADVTTLTGHATSRVDSPSFDHSAGTKEFELAENTVRVVLAGSYRGVSGTYYCTPTDANTNCSAAVAASGFTLAGGTWTFKPTNPESRFMDVPDAIYASYGWWIHKSEDGMTFTASAFAANKGAVPGATGIDTLMGTATYMGGAAGKYALHSSTGGTNDAGHFTADAMLKADFSENSISGTIDNFMGADGMARNWSVELMNSSVSGTGAIAGDPDDSTDTAAQMTKWTIDGTAAAAAGSWEGMLYDNGDDDVPKVATGTFYSMYGRDGKMVGAFGVNKQ